MTIFFFFLLDNNLRNKTTKSNKVATLNGKKKCEEQPVDESPPMTKRLIRAFPRYKVIDDDAPKTTEKTTTKTTKTTKNVRNGDDETIDKESTDQNDKDMAGLIVKFKRVRESELSKLTYEADNFMFPKQRDEVLTDDDRQSTSEQDRDGDLSSDILSSEYSSQRETLSTSHNNSLNVSALSDQYTSTGRRKKRRSQYDTDTFKSPLEQKRKFRTSLIQSRLSSVKGQLSLTKTTSLPTATGTQTSEKPTKRSAKISAVKVAKATATTRSNQQRRNSNVSTPATVTTTDIEMLDDRMGENAYNGGKLLATEYFQNLKFSFERVPTNEPWYLTFQRQDEHRERMFEYWGNTGNLVYEPSSTVIG